MANSIIPEISSEGSEFRSEQRRAAKAMSSVVAAQDLTVELGRMLAPEGGWKERVSAIHRKLVDEKFEHRLPDLKWSRVKNWFYGEARIIKFEEMVALKELAAIEEARSERLKLAATANRLAALLAAEGAPLDRRQTRILGRLVGAVDRPGKRAA